MLSFLWKNGVGLAVTFIGERHLRSRIELSRNVFFFARDRPRLPQHFRAKPAVFVPIAVFFLKQYHWRLGYFQSNARKNGCRARIFFSRETSRVCPSIFARSHPRLSQSPSVFLSNTTGDWEIFNRTRERWFSRARIFLRASRNGVEHS